MSSRTALFVIDIQNDLATDPQTRIPHADRLLDAAGKVLASARRRLDDAAGEAEDRPLIVFVQHEEDPSSGALVRGSKPWELVFAPRPGHGDEVLVAKMDGDTFESNADLAERLRAAGVGSVAALGIQSDCCVRATCQGALAAGFGVTVLRGAHSTYDCGGKPAEEIERDVEAELERAGAKVVPWQDVIVE